MDTNVLISAALFPKHPLGKIIGRALEFQNFALLVLDPWHGIRIVTPTDFGTLMEDVGKR